MEFRLLGLLQVVDNVDGPVQIVRGRESGLLALLLIHANEPLSNDRIVDELWGRGAPENASKSVQIYVSRLRKALGGDRIETTPAGYRLRVRDDELDVAAFESLARRGREALEAGDAGSAEALLDDALAVWRGDALADFAYDAFAQEPARRLHERRDVAVADRIDARLARGRAQEVIPDLEALVERSPLWERPRAQLMLALYRCGRQTDALELARATRAVFLDELGLEPGSAVQDLERRILNHDPALGAPGVSTARVLRQRRSIVLLGIGGLLLAGAAVAAVVVTGGGSTASLVQVAPDSLAVIDPSSNSVTAQIPIGSAPSSVAVGAGGVWVANAGDETLARLDPASNQVVERIGLGAIPGQVAAGPTALWITTARPDRGAVLQVDPAAQTVRTLAIPVHNDDPYAPAAPNALVAVGVGVWANTFHSQLVQLPGPLPPIVHRLGPQHSVDGIAYGAGSLWISSGVDDRVLRVDPGTGRIVAQIPIAAVPGRRVAGPYGIAYGMGAVWVAATLEDRVVRIDPQTNAVTAAISVGRRPTEIAVGNGSVWALAAGDGSVIRIDPATSRVVRTIPIGRDVTGIAAGDGHVYATVAGAVLASAARGARVQPLSSTSCGPLMQGAGTPDLLIVSDLPTFPAGPGSSPDAGVDDMRAAIVRVLQEHGFRAGRFRVAYQACNDAPRNSGVTPEQCAANARTFAAAGVAGVIGPYNSSCAAIEVPILDTAPRGPIAIASPSTTYVGLTHSGPSTAVDEPDRYYPLKVRNFVRLLGADDAQGAGLAQLARQLKARRIFVLDDGDPTAEAMAAYVTAAAQRLGLRVAGSRHWTAARSPLTALKHFAPLATAVAATHPDAVILTGCICTNGPPLVIALRHALGADVPLLGSDNFTFATDMSHGPSEMLGMYLTNAGTAATLLPATSQGFLRELLPGRPLNDIQSLVPLAAQAAEALLDAIAHSNGTSASITASLTGEPRFNRDGDPIRTPVTVVRITRPAPPEPHLGLQGVAVDRLIEANPALTAPLSSGP